MRVAIYCRLSEEDRNKAFEKDDSLSIQNQKAMLQAYAAAQGWEIYRIYSDDDYTGSDRRRPEFNRLLQDAQDRRFDIVLCKTQSRFTRELELVEKYIHGLFPIWGIRFVSIVDNADTDNRGNKKSRQINGLVNEWYLEDMSENIRSVLTSRRQNGFHIGAFALYGYRKDPDRKGHLLVDEEAAAVVQEVFTLFSQGYGKSAIARLLNDRGIPNPTEYKRLHGLRYRQPPQKHGTLWKYAAIASMLTNEIYLGNMVQGKYGSISYKTKKNKPRPPSEWYRVEGTHEPIIDRALWNQVQNLLAQRSRPFASGTIGLFAGKARCAGCGCILRSSKNRGKHYLQCPTRRFARDACPGSFISVERLEQLVLSELNRLSAAYLDMDALEKGVVFCDHRQAQQERLLAQQQQCQKRMDEYARGIRALYLDKAKGLLGQGDYEALLQDFSHEKERMQQALQGIEEQLAEMESSAPARQRCDLLEQYLHPSHLTRDMVEALIDHIVVGKRIPGARDVPMEIHWNF